MSTLPGRAGLLALLVLSPGCSDLAAPDSTPSSASASRSLEMSGARHFISFGATCFDEMVGMEPAGDLLLVTFLNSNYESSRDPWVAGPAQTTITIGLDAETGEPRTLHGSFHYTPEGVNGTWEGTVVPMEFRKGRLDHIRTEGIGTGELAGYGIRFAVNLHARATSAPPKVVCGSATPFISTGEIFALD